MYTKLLLIISLSILALIFSNSAIEQSYSINIDPESAATKLSGVDKFGIKEIYPTKEGGREWFMNMSEPLVDNAFSLTFN
ncbi:MAG: hypothetical protein M3O68_07710, partial [Thermoproteota archaeon]|nr:hypothetical protein [Thermoproteota archaeon]